MKQAFERNGKLVENTVGYFNAGLTSERVEIAKEMEANNQTGHIESNMYWVADDYDFDAQDEE